MSALRQPSVLLILVACGLLLLWAFYPENDDPLVMAEVRCAATALVLADLLPRLQAANGAVSRAEVAHFADLSERMSLRVARLRAAGSHETAYMQRMITEETRFRDDLSASDGAEAWARNAMARVQSCAGDASAHLFAPVFVPVKVPV
ncbi:hypothetical protein [Tropicibacter naphthalenivorans]|uniref:Uncharacterized protein n=1 Tax=Tropicibacter naphthalenivorans TaxID=441103 RepID=A0A0P1G8U6_9RHOB|nr:hypothetical protein [Tropicibacter naphthalenivorans]CUH78000.1 hypothetical protein TRN7648_01740 [Tropicibacter naphthalenivorans]SMC94274.1 hypothetical protein SAMN04488093_107102 [Tropicibacter naphthalenivorans]